MQSSILFATEDRKGIGISKMLDVRQSFDLFYRAFILVQSATALLCAHMVIHLEDESKTALSKHALNDFLERNLEEEQVLLRRKRRICRSLSESLSTFSEV
jgi:hypothetical protein